MVVARFMKDGVPVGDVQIQIANIHDLPVNKTIDEAAVANAAIKPKPKLSAKYSITTGLSNYGIFFAPSAKLNWKDYNYQLEFFTPANIVFDSEDDKSYYYVNNYLWTKVGSHQEIEYQAGLNAGYGRVQDIEKKYFYSVGPQLGLKFRNISLMSSIDVLVTDVSRFFSKLVFDTKNDKISYFIAYDEIDVKKIAFEEKILSGGIQLSW